MFAAGRVLFPSVGKVGKEKDGGAFGDWVRRHWRKAHPSQRASLRGTNVTSPNPRSADASPSTSQRTEIMHASSQLQGRGQKVDIEMTLGLLPSLASPSCLPVGP